MENQKIINLCLTCDDNYIEHLYVTLYSLLVNLDKKYCCHVYILDGGLNKKSKDLVDSLQDKFIGTSISYIEIKVEKYSIYPSMFGTYQTYFRLDIPNVIPYNIEKVLYLDPDIVVNGDISVLYNIDINNYAIAAPTEEKIHLVYDYILEYHNRNGYFNGGVLLINLKYFRENKLSEKLIKYLVGQKNNYFCDQDALNYVLDNKRFPIQWKYNVTEIVAYRYYFKKDKSIIIHYCGGGKPWLDYCTHPLRNLYIKYRKDSGLNDLKLNESKLSIRFLKSKYQQIYYILRAFFPKIIYLVGILRYNIIKK